MLRCSTKSRAQNSFLPGAVVKKYIKKCIGGSALSLQHSGGCDSISACCSSAWATKKEPVPNNVQGKLYLSFNHCPALSREKQARKQENLTFRGEFFQCRWGVLRDTLTTWVMLDVELTGTETWQASKSAGHRDVSLTFDCFHYYWIPRPEDSTWLMISSQ